MTVAIQKGITFNTHWYTRQVSDIRRKESGTKHTIHNDRWGIMTKVEILLNRITITSLFCLVNNPYLLFFGAAWDLPSCMFPQELCMLQLLFRLWCWRSWFHAWSLWHSKHRWGEAWDHILWQWRLPKFLRFPQSPQARMNRWAQRLWTMMRVPASIWHGSTW